MYFFSIGRLAAQIPFGKRNFIARLRLPIQIINTRRATAVATAAVVIRIRLLGFGVLRRGRLRVAAIAIHIRAEARSRGDPENGGGIQA